jgi:hypothetical protein
MDQRLNSSWWALRIALGAVPFLAGLDKFFQPSYQLDDVSPGFTSCTGGAANFHASGRGR